MKDVFSTTVDKAELGSRLSAAVPGRSLARRDRRSGRRGAENWEDLVGRLRLTSGPCPPPPRHCTTPQVRWALPCCCLINGLTGEISGGERLSPGFHTPSTTTTCTPREYTVYLTRVRVTGAKEGQAAEFLPPMMGVRSRGRHFLFGRDLMPLLLLCLFTRL